MLPQPSPRLKAICLWWRGPAHCSFFIFLKTLLKLWEEAEEMGNYQEKDAQLTKRRSSSFFITEKNSYSKGSFTLQIQ